MVWRQAKQTASKRKASKTVTLYLLTESVPQVIVTTLQTKQQQRTKVQRK
jgi:hypothetical protein